MTVQKIFVIFGLICWLSQSVMAGTLVVNNRSPHADDRNPGTDQKPLKSIQAAADLAQPGDTILVKAGIYREAVKPPRGGTKEKPIVYTAAPGEEVSIRGSEQVTNWVNQGGGVWMAELQDGFFKGFNPFAVHVSGAWLGKPKPIKTLLVKGRNPAEDKYLPYHLGDVYLNNEAYFEKFTLSDVQKTKQSWYCECADGKTHIWVNFAGADPNVGLTEVNARATAFFPEKSGLKFIVLDGFDVRHTASQWSDIYRLEEGAIGMKYGYRWTIQNCRISYSRNNGISMGVSDEVIFPFDLAKGGEDIPPYGTFGFHLIQNNRIARCGQCGIYGCYGAVGSILEGNEITETVYRKEWQGANQADIKILFPIDVIIRNNRLYGPDGAGIGIWLDWGSQNARVTGNVIADRKFALFTEVSFGPTLFDHNVVINSGIRDWSDGNIYAHNLFVGTHLEQVISRDRNFVPYYKPHTTEVAGRGVATLRFKKWHNNIFIGGPKRPDGDGYTATHNIYLDEAVPFSCEGKESIVDATKSDFLCKKEDGAWILSLTLGEKVAQARAAFVSSRFIGKIPLAEMYMEHPDGSPLDISSDYFGRAIAPEHVKPGPFQNIRAGKNEFVVWPRASQTASAFRGLCAESAPDISTVPADLRIPEITEGTPGPGKRVRFKLFTNAPPVVLYLPSDWSPERTFPVIVELAGNGNYKNAFGDISTGIPEGSNLGYGLSGGRGYVWVCLPFLTDAGDAVATTWWGNAKEYKPDSTVAFIKRAVPALCAQFSGDPGRVMLCGFSRGSIAANAIGLHDDEISSLWRAFVCYSHYDGVREGWPFAGSDRPAARTRLARLVGRPQLICHESVSGKTNLEATRCYLDKSGIKGDFTFLETGFRNHNDGWVLRPSSARDAAREWLSRVLREPAGSTVERPAVRR